MGEVDIPANFKTSLPPRKRAKTKEEKEQRRIERILRNRKAAHASREKKRKHVEFLESYVLDLEKQSQLVKLLNEKLLATYTGGNAEIDSLVNKIAAMPDLNAKKLQHATELDSVGCEDEDDEHNHGSPQMQLPKTPESFTSSPKSVQDDVPELENSRHGSVSYTPPYMTSEESSPVTMDKFSLDIITAEPMSSDNSLGSDEVFVKKEVMEEFIPQVGDMTPFSEKVGFEDFQVKMEDNDFVLGELRNPAVIAVDGLHGETVAHLLGSLVSAEGLR